MIVSAVEGVPDGVSPDEITNGGYVVHALQAGLYYALGADSATDAIVRAVDAGGDADTVGAITGAVTGARVCRRRDEPFVPDTVCFLGRNRWSQCPPSDLRQRR